LTSQDDGEKNFCFTAFDRVMTEMDGASTNIGGILAAMVYQIEQDNKKASPTTPHNLSVHEEQESLRGHSIGLATNHNSIEV